MLNAGPAPDTCQINSNSLIFGGSVGSKRLTINASSRIEGFPNKFSEPEFRAGVWRSAFSVQHFNEGKMDYFFNTVSNSRKIRLYSSVQLSGSVKP